MPLFLRQLGGIGRRARLKIEFERVWVRVPQLVGKQPRSKSAVALFFWGSVKEGGLTCQSVTAFNGDPQEIIRVKPKKCGI